MTQTFLYLLLAMGLAGTIGSIYGISEASKIISGDKNHISYCDKPIKAIVNNISNDTILVELQKHPDRLIRMPYISYIHLDEEVKIYSDCHAECFTGSQIEFHGKYSWRPPVANQYTPCVMTITGMSITALSSFSIFFVAIIILFTMQYSQKDEDLY
jgi:hypothetical protein